MIVSGSPAMAVEAGAYVAFPPDVAEVDMNGDFASVHALRNGVCDSGRAIAILPQLC